MACAFFLAMVSPIISDGKDPEKIPANLIFNYNFSLQDLAGHVIPMSTWHGQVLLLNFWATWCAPCVADLPTLSALNETVRAKPKTVVLCITWERRAVVEKFLRAHHLLKAPVYLADSHLVNVFQIKAIPTTLIVTPEGRIITRSTGGRDWNDPQIIKFLDQIGTTAGNAPGS
jgi:thiol-disulfide isomerase/thioredoxin